MIDLLAALLRVKAKVPEAPCFCPPTRVPAAPDARAGHGRRFPLWFRHELSGKLRDLDCDTVDMEINELDDWYESTTFAKNIRVVSELILP